MPVYRPICALVIGRVECAYSGVSFKMLVSFMLHVTKTCAKLALHAITCTNPRPSYSEGCYHTY